MNAMHTPKGYSLMQADIDSAKFPCTLYFVLCSAFLEPGVIIMILIANGELDMCHSIIAIGQHPLSASAMSAPWCCFPLALMHI